jgi:Nucleotide modification associated domain 1
LKNTAHQYNSAVEQCRGIFEKKTKDYGTAWRILRPKSLTDQIFIKAQRIRSIEEKQANKVGEGIDSEYIGIYNYCVLALIQLKLGSNEEMEMDAEKVQKMYDVETLSTLELMNDKNHDYGEAWRDMRVSTFTDLILMKILRIRQIEDNDGRTLISEGLDGNYRDMMNYAIFALIRRGENS